MPAARKQTNTADEYQRTLPRIRFSFNPEKLADAMAFLAEAVRDLSTIKALKLLYLADREHLLRHGRPILGDWYACMEYGPVAAKTYERLKQIQAPEAGVKLEGLDLLRRRIKLDDPKRKYPYFKRHGKKSLKALSPSEIEILRDVVRLYGRKPWKEIVNFTHQHAAWQKSDALGEHTINYRWFFEDAPGGHDHMRELMESEQENRDFMRNLTAK